MNNPPPASVKAHKQRVLVIDAHPRADSFCQGLVAAAANGASAAQHEVRWLALRELSFDLNHKGQALEPSLEHSRQELLWADHILIVYPVWWGSMPALLKGWLDRVLQPGFAFAEREDGGWEGLLGGRSATLIATMDTPRWIFGGMLHSCSIRALRDATLRFCGVSPVRVLLFSPIRTSTPELRRHWLEQARLEGHDLEKNLRTGWRPRLRAWLQAVRPQFYLFPWLALTAGAVSAAAARGASLQWMPYLLCWAAAWLLEGMAVLTNEIHDEETDILNRNSGLFTGGSRVVVQGRMSMAQLHHGRMVAGGCLALVGLLLVFAHGANLAGVLALLLVGLVLSIGYTAPPLKLSYRTLGEFDVALTHSALMVLLGHCSQGGGGELRPWLIAAPMFFSILPAIILAGFPDMEADIAAGKKTLVVRFGLRAAATAALCATFVAAILHAALFTSPAWFFLALLIHCSALMLALAACVRQQRAGRINGLLALALSYMMWFVWVPWMHSSP